MDSILRGAAVYLVLFLVFRISGRRTLSQITTFDFVVLLILSETVQEALIDGDHSMTNGFLLVLTLLGADIVMTRLGTHVKFLRRWLDDPPLVIVENGKPLSDRLRANRVEEEEVLAAARERQGLERMDQIKYAVLEASGEITIVPHRAT